MTPRRSMQRVLDRLNDLFGDEEFSQGQKQAFVDALRSTLMADEALVQQAEVNLPQQFADSRHFDDAVVDAVADNQGAHTKMADYFFANDPGRAQLIVEIAHWFHTAARAE